jgi:hypothetical protein
MTDIIFEIIGNGEVLYGKHHKRNDAHKNRITQGRFRKRLRMSSVSGFFVVPGGQNPFAGCFECDHEQYKTDYSKKDHGVLIAFGIVAFAKIVAR